jgi:hypothetical protein
MSDLSRRGFVKGALALPVVGMPISAAPEMPTQTPLDDALLRALADVVLPAELGDARIAAAVAAFQSWLGGYEPVAERNHGYGTGEISYLPPDPAPGWAAQLRALDLEATKRHGQGFADADREARHALVVRHLSGERGARLPAPLEAGHVALGLLAWWCDSPGAHDLAYRARIAPNACRPLAASPEQPSPMEGR